MGQAQKRKLQRKLQQPVGPVKNGGRWIAVALLSVLLIQVPHDTYRPVRILTEAEGLELVNGLITATSPTLPENSFMPPLMKEKIQWIYDTHALQLQNGHKFVNAIGGYLLDEHGNENNRVLMTSGYDKGQPFINIFLTRLFVIVRDQYKVEKGFNETAEHMFAMGLVHEAIHLEMPQSFYERQRTAEEQLAEEVRTWRKTVLEIVRPLRQTGRIVEIDFIAADAALSKCGDPYNCPAFEEFVRRQQDGTAILGK